MGATTDHGVVGKEARVTGRVAVGATGEVAVNVRGGMESFFAFPDDPDDVFEVGEIVIVTAYEPSRTVRVRASRD